MTLISSDGHVAARLADHRPYLESAYLEHFDAFLIEYAKHGVVTFDATNVAARLDPDDARDSGRRTSPTRRPAGCRLEPRTATRRLNREGIAAEVLSRNSPPRS